MTPLLRSTITANMIVLPTLSIKNPYTPLIFYAWKTYETRVMPILNKFHGRYVLLHVSLQDKSDHDMGANTVSSIVGRSKRICASDTSLPDGWPRCGHIIAIIEIGQTVLVRKTEAAATAVWENRSFVSREAFFSTHIAGLYATRIVCTHKLKHPVHIPRGYVGLHPCMLPYTCIPDSIDIPRMRTESIMEKTRMASWLDSVARLW